MANPGQDKYKKKGGQRGAASRDARRAKQVLAGLGTEAETLFNDLAGRISNSLKKGATEGEKAFGDMAKILMKDFQDVEFAATQVGKAGYVNLDYRKELYTAISALPDDNYAILYSGGIDSAIIMKIFYDCKKTFTPFGIGFPEVLPQKSRLSICKKFSGVGVEVKVGANANVVIASMGTTSLSPIIIAVCASLVPLSIRDGSEANSGRV